VYRLIYHPWTRVFRCRSSREDFYSEGKENMNGNTELKANLGIVLRGEVVALKSLLERLDGLISETPEVQLVHKHVSASKLWLKEGGEMNERPRDR
jgi:hypothetical protein